MPTTIVWLRHDLRLRDNPALQAAAARGAVVPLWIDEGDTGDPWRPGAASRVWLHDGLAAFDALLVARGSRLVIARGAPLDVLRGMLTACAADAVFWNRRHTPAGIAGDSTLKAALAEHCEVRSFAGNLLFEPGAVMTGGGTPYKVFTPFYRACLAAGPPPAPPPEPAALAPPARWPSSLQLDDLALEPHIDWTAGIRARWQAGERTAQARLATFIDDTVIDYPERRDQPAAGAISGLSPYFCQGALGVRDAWAQLSAASAASGNTPYESAAAAWLRQLVWREFAWHLLFHFPHTTDAPLRDEFADMVWVDDAEGLAAWQRGRTGFPLVDAGMRELWETGFMHNRVRMVTASLLTKHLGQHWLAGAHWFWDTLVDGDLANNSLGWQWVAGCGADAAPYFRIFNPYAQSRKFDPDGVYLRRWLPELAALDAAQIHQPPPGIAGYPAPIVDLAPAREAALARYAEIRR
ncbi:MAG: deoxyribodipyrimidine photo-lyase [Gammaproteobacteria bacterium]|nr:deoxyribodipyrimidine photo-lyase [Gammaproteobacteria bacterium]